MKAVKPMDTIMNENIRNGIKQPLIVAPGQRGNISQVFVVVEAWRLKFSGASFQR
jgi:2-phospho-L-lactate guanylyltransferase (CobY/MobA/RfbA family)